MSERVPRETGTVPWGAVEPGLLDDQVRYDAYAAAHHVAAHHWALYRADVPFGPVGASLRLPPGLDGPVIAEVEATAVLVEAVSIEFARDLYRVADFGLSPSDIDISTVRLNCISCARHAAERGCGRWAARASRPLFDADWVSDTLWHVLREWTEIAALATAVGRGSVLETDEVEAVLTWW